MTPKKDAKIAELQTEIFKLKSELFKIKNENSELKKDICNYSNDEYCFRCEPDAYFSLKPNSCIEIRGEK